MPETHKPEQTHSGTNKAEDTRGGKYLTFFLAEEEYGLEILKVQEIFGMMEVTPVPRTPHYIKGVINLRGKVIPVVDLRTKFEMDSVEYTDQTCIIVVQTGGMQTGIIVDKVSEVIDIAGDQIEDTPHMGNEVNTDYILGIGNANDRVKLLLDIDKVLGGDVVDDLQMATSAGSVTEGMPTPEEMAV